MVIYETSGGGTVVNVVKTWSRAILISARNVKTLKLSGNPEKEEAHTQKKAKLEKYKSTTAQLQ